MTTVARSLSQEGGASRRRCVNEYCTELEYLYHACCVSLHQAKTGLRTEQASNARTGDARLKGYEWSDTDPYTHLTLPTIYSV